MIILNVLKRFPALVLLIACVLLVQQHSIEFWQAKAGLSYQQAMHWSILLEAGSAWLITRRVWWQTVLAISLSLIVVAGPLYQVSNELIVTLNAPANAAEMQAKLETLLIAQVDQQEDSLSTFNKNSETRAGWLNAINGASDQLNANQDELKSFYQSQLTAEEPTWVAAAILAMQAASLVIFQLLIILTTRSAFAPLPVLTTKMREEQETGKAISSVGKQKAARGKASPLKVVKAAAATMRQVRAAS